MIELDEDEIPDGQLDEMRAHLMEAEGVARRVMAHEYVLSFNRQCMYTSYDHTVADVDGHNKRVWTFRTNMHGPAMEFMDAIMDIPGVSNCLQRMDKGGILYFSWEEP